jgi:hypothetical protein
MAVFPAIEPSSRSYDLGGFAAEQHQGAGGAGTRFLTGGDDPLGHELTLGYEGIDREEMRQIRRHRRGQYGGHVSFTLPAIILRGHPLEGILPADGRWKYAGPTPETQRGRNLYDVSVPLVYVGPEPPPV